MFYSLALFLAFGVRLFLVEVKDQEIDKQFSGQCCCNLYNDLTIIGTLCYIWVKFLGRIFGASAEHVS